VAGELPGLVAGRLYHYRLVATNASGTTEGQDRVMVAGRTPGTDTYRAAVLGTPGLAAYWRLGELSGSAGGDELPGGAPGTFAGRSVLGQPGVLGPLGNTSASFDGASGELSAPGSALGASATLEGWFRWRAGTSAMRDHTSAGGAGWILAFNNAGRLHYRLAGKGFDTGLPIARVRDGAWHHIVATKTGAAAALYVDGQRVHSGNGAGPDPVAQPWHVMRNGAYTVFSEGEADEVALYTRALTGDEVLAHHDLARGLAARPLPPETSNPVAEPPAAGTGAGGGVLGSAGPASRPAGRASVRGARLIVRGAPGRRNRLSARRRGRAWRIADAAAPLRAGAGCARVGPRTVSCRAAGVKRIEMHGGAGADSLTVAGRTRALLYGGPGADRLVGGPLTRFRGGPGADLIVRRRAPAG
jgi:Concanavalin A-like lectin/glucanases superfamily